MATFYYRLRCTTEGLDKDGFAFPALTSSSIGSPPAAVCPTNGGHTVAADSLTLIASSGGQEVGDTIVTGTADVSGGTLLAPQGTGTAPIVAGSVFFKTDTNVLSIGDGSSARGVVDLTGTQTLTNKTLTTPVIATISNGGTITIPSGTDTLVGRATTDTLTNKTLTTPTIGSFTNAQHDHSNAAGGGNVPYTGLTYSGLTAGQVLAATAANTAAFVARAFSKGGTVLSPSAQNVILWRAPFACTVTALKGHRVGGTGATVNAGKGTVATPTVKVLASDLSLTSADAWTDGGAVQNTAFAIGDPLILILQTVSGTPTQVAVQIDFTRP